MADGMKRIQLLTGRDRTGACRPLQGGRRAAAGLLMACALAPLVSCRAHVKVYRVPDATEAASSFGSDKQGVYYALPKTVVVAKVPVSRTDVAPGRYQKFAMAFFPYLDEKEDIVKEKAIQLKLGQASLESKAIADPKNVFMIKMNPDNGFKFWHWFDSNSYDAKLSEIGTPTSITAEATNDTGAFIVQAIKSGAAIYGQVLAGGTAAIATADATKVRSFGATTPCTPTYSASEVTFANRLRTDATLNPDLEVFYCAAEHAGRRVIERVAVTPELIGPFVAYFSRYLPANGANPMQTPDAIKDLNLFLGAAANYNELRELATRRMTLLGGNAGLQDSKAFQAALDAIDSRMDALMQDFTGTAKKTIDWWTGTFWIVPKGQTGSVYEAFGPITLSVAPLQLFVFSAAKGICDIQTAAHSAYEVIMPQEVTRVACTKDDEPQVVQLAQDFSQEQTAKVVAAAQKGSRLLAKQPNGLYFRVPAAGRFAVVKGKYVMPDAATNTPATTTATAASTAPTPATAANRTPTAGTPATDTATKLEGLSVLAFSEFQIAQYGPVSAMPTGTGGSKVRYQLDSYPDSGAVKGIIVTKQNLIDPAAVGSMGDAAIAAMKAKQDYDKAKEPKTESEESKLTSQLRIQLLQECLADSSKSFCKDLVK